MSKPQLANLAITALVAALFLTLGPATAQTPAISFTPNSLGAEDFASNTGQNSYNLGYEFTANGSVTITSVGYFFDPSVGFTQDHPVGIYDLSGNLLDSSIVSGNTANDTANGLFEYTPLAGSGLTLTPGTSYVIAGVTGPTDPFYFDVQDYTDPNNPGDGLITPPQITYDEDVFTVGNKLADFPTTTDGMPGSYFGPNFLFTPNGAPAVPEPSPSVIVLAALAFVGLLIVRRRISQKAGSDANSIAP